MLVNKKNLLIFLGLLIGQSLIAQNTIVIRNETGQRIDKLQYWLGSENQSQNPNKQFKSRSAIPKGRRHKIPVKFHRKKRNSIIVKAYLAGGGYVSAEYSVERGEKKALIPLYSPAKKVPQDDFEKIIKKFKEFNFDEKYLKLTTTNGLKSTLGGIIVVDKSEKKVLYKITPKELKSEMSGICRHTNRDYTYGIFSSKTAINGNLSLPFVRTSLAFTQGDVAKFKWTIENVGECRWIPPKNKDLATLFSELSLTTKDALIQIYKSNKGAKMKFINRAFIIGRIEIETFKSKSINRNTELTGSSFITGKGNFELIDEYKSETTINDVITKVDGYYVNSLLVNLYLLHLADKKNKLTQKENTRLKNEFKYLSSLYPGEFSPTNDLELMKKQILELRKKNGGKISYLKKKEGDTKIKLDKIEKSLYPLIHRGI